MLGVQVQATIHTLPLIKNKNRRHIFIECQVVSPVIHLYIHMIINQFEKYTKYNKDVHNMEKKMSIIKLG